MYCIASIKTAKPHVSKCVVQQLTQLSIMVA
jgi:hypothetical protein